MPKPRDYRYIAAWGRMVGSFGYYVEQQQREAAAEGAPLDAICRGDDRWMTAAELEPPTRKELESLLP